MMPTTPITLETRAGKRYDIKGFSMTHLKHCRKNNGLVQINTDHGMVQIEGKDIRSLTRK